MRIRTFLVSAFSFVIGLFHNLAQLDRRILAHRTLASVLILAMLLPIVFFGQVKTVSANTFPVNPLVEMPSVILAPPQPFLVGNKSSILNNSPLLALSVWDYFSSWFDSAPENTEPSQVAAPPTGADLSRARLSPKNQTGGTSLYSRNFGWGTGLAGLSGRGLDAGFGISYNSLTWIRVGNEMIFNPNNDNVTPGFRFGFPVIEPQYADSLTGKNTFLMVTPSGSRVEFRQMTGSSDTFETADSSYIQLKVLDANNLVITGTDGTNAFYQLKNGAFRCQQIKDSNGNYITVDHDTNGLLQSVTDTLGRVISVNYDAQGSPISVTQQRGNSTFTFASLSYANLTISTNFSGLNLVGITNGATIKVLNKVTYADGSHTDFDYNGYGQVWKVSNYAADNHKLNHVATDLGNVNGQQIDVPRFSEMRNWTENFNLDNSNVAQEVVIPILYQENAGFTIPGGGNYTGTLLQVTAPDGTISKTFVGNSGWMEAVPVLTEDWANNIKQRWSYTAYTQDDINLPYLLNPRTVEAKIGDANNVRRSTMEYWTNPNNTNASVFGLVKEVKVYDADQSTVLKRTTTEYNLDNNYLNRRIIGLPAKSELYDQANNLMAKVTYAYDEGNFSEAGQTIAPIQQDATNYGAGFIVGRGNATSTTRWDVTDSNNANKAITARVKYNTAGSPVASLDPLNREIKTSYADNFDDGNNNRNTFAYPTTITDPAGLSSTVKYKYDFGANVFAQSPAPAGQSVGKQTSRIYDALGRLEKETVINTGAYTRYEYPTNGIQSRVFSTITDVNNNGADAADEVLSESFSDGSGRTRQSRTEHPGSAGGWSGSLVEYDIMGRVKRSTVPTEINSGWTPSGDDATRGWLWSSQEYDWKGRVVRQINTDGTDKLISYEGCGCAGGQVTTVSGEQLAEGRRRQKVYEDILGRTYKSETLNWDGSVYSTSKTTFNGRDQAVLIRNYSGTDTSTVFQETAVSYDGHGRVKTQHLPQQDANKATIFDYNPDDSLAVKTDGRGATSTYTYDNRKLVTRIDYNLSTTVTPTPTPTPVQTNNSSPIGYLDAADSINANAWGWSYDPDNSSASNTVHIYIDGPAGSGTFVGSVTANQPRADVNQAMNVTGNHGYVFDIPEQYWDGNTHSIYAYGIDTGSNTPSLLTGSPKYFTIADPNGPSCNPLQMELNSCQWGGGSWNYDTCSCDYGGYYYSRMINPDNRKKFKAERVKKLKKIKELKEKKNKKKDTTPITALRCWEEDPDCNPDPDPTPTPTPNPTPTPPPNAPTGVFETIDTTNRTLKGWALDPNNPNTPTRVEFLIVGSTVPNGQMFLGSTYANQIRPDVNQSTGVAGDHGFSFAIPRRFQDGQNYSVYASIFNGSSWNFISGSPKNFNFTYQTPTAPTNTSVIFTYDNLGNRTSMTDSSGNTTYEYNQLSQLTAETRQVPENLPDAPLSNNRFKLQYSYTYTGQLKSLTDPFGEQINYGHDKAGRLNSVTGSSYGNVTNYATNPGYRAWGGLKGLTYGNGMQMSMSYNNRLQASSYQIAGAGVTQGYNVMQKNYQYYNDGSLKYTQDVINPIFDRLNIYDQVGRVSEGKSGAEARGQTVAQVDMPNQLPYRQSYQYDAFNNLTQRNNLHWGIDYWQGQSNNLTYNYNPTNNRLPGYSYDPDGRVTTTAEDWTNSTYDASGMVSKISGSDSEILRYYDGNGRESKRRSQRFVAEQYIVYWVDEGNTFYIRSSILGNEVVSEVNKYGDKIKTNVIAAGNIIATQENHVTYEQVIYNQWDASGSSYKASDRIGSSYEASGTDGSPAELDPLGGNMGRETPYVEQPSTPNLPEGDNEPFLLDQEDTMLVDGQQVPCELDGMRIGCQQAMRSLNHGSAIIDPFSPFPSGLASQIGLRPINGPDGGDVDLEHNTVNISAGDVVGWEWDGSTTAISNQIVSTRSPEPLIQSAEDENQKLIDQAIKDAKNIFDSDSECSKFFEQAIKIATIFSTENGETKTEEVYRRFDATAVADTLGKQLTPGTIFKNGQINKTIGIEMSSTKDSSGYTTVHQGMSYRVFGKATVNNQGPFLGTGTFGSYSGRAGRALAVLHEIAHMIITGVARDKNGKPIDSTYLIADDGSGQVGADGKSQSEINTDLIETKCKKELDALVPNSNKAKDKP